MLDVVKICNRIIEYSFYSLFFLVPLILTPWNYELFEFNKMILVYLITIIIVSAWVIKIIASKKIIFKRSFWDIPLILFFLSQFVSYTLSIDHHTSAWGYYSRFNGGLLSIIDYLLLYWSFVSNMNKKSTLSSMIILLVSGLFVSVYGILEHLGIDAKYWVQDVRNRVFSTLGQPNWLAAWLITLIPLTWAFVLSSIAEKAKQSVSRLRVALRLRSGLISYGLLFIIFYLCLLYTRSRSAVAAFAITFVVYWALVFLTSQKNRKLIFIHFLVITLLTATISGLIGTPWTSSISQILKPNSPPVPSRLVVSTVEPVEGQSATEQTTITNQPLLISESGDIRKVVWKGAIDIWKHHPVFGTGPETFAYSYYWYRPREHNDLSEWDFLYNKAHNEYLNYAATTGAVGLGAYLILIASFLFWQIKNIKKVGSVGIAFFSGFISILITNFFGFSVVPVSVLFFLYPAMSVSLKNDSSQDENKPKLSEGQYGLVLAVLILATYLFASVVRYWYADAQFSSGDKLNKSEQYDSAFNALQKAVSLKPNEPIYRDELSLTSSSLAVLSFKQDNATLAAELQKLAIAESDKAIKISPYNINFWKNRTKVFYRLAEINTGFYQKALESLLVASELAPTEPKIKYNLGLIYATLGQNQQAIKTLEEVIILKPNYEDARYALALFYEQVKKKDEAKEQLEYILKNINPASEKAKEKLKTI